VVTAPDLRPTASHQVSELLKTVSPIPLDHAMAELLHTGRWEGELVRSRKDGTQVAIASRWSLQRDARGTPVAALETNNDITERKRAEQQRERLRQLEGDLAHINRVSMMGELAASLAHEIKQPIAAIATLGPCCAGCTANRPRSKKLARVRPVSSTTRTERSISSTETAPSTAARRRSGS
jgi:C4-dicarboxylate-specific signal transduction histidine kinase